MAAASALSQFTLLAQSQQGKACEAIVKQALDHSSIFVFGELLECPNVQALSGSPDGARLLDLLRIFAYGTYQDYKAQAASLPALTPAQTRKLQLLTIVSMASKERVIPFSDIAAAVEMDSTRELEDLIIDAVYQNLIDAKMDQEKQRLEVLTSTCRDCRDEDIDFIIETLTAWGNSASNMLDSLDNTALSDLPLSPQLLSQGTTAQKLQRQSQEIEALIAQTNPELLQECRAAAGSAADPGPAAAAAAAAGGAWPADS